MVVLFARPRRASSPNAAQRRAEGAGLDGEGADRATSALPRCESLSDTVREIEYQFLHIITGGTSKYAGITGREPFKCITKATPAGEPAGSFAIDIPHNTTWEIK
jgi:hypothetical protein